MKKLLAILLTLLMLTAAAAETMIANPWTDADPDRLMQALGLSFGVPEGAQDVAYRMLEAESLAEMQFTLGDASLTARIRPAMFEDISGMYYEWTSDEPVSVGWCEGRLMRAPDGEETADLLLWWDAAPGLMYSLSALSPEGIDLLPVADDVYLVTQDDVDGLTAEGLAEVLAGCTGYAGTAGSSLKEAIAACALASYAVKTRAAECDLSVAEEALSLLSAEQRSDLAFHLEGIRALLADAFDSFEPMRGLFDDAGCLGSAEEIFPREDARNHCEALLSALP